MDDYVVQVTWRDRGVNKMPNLQSKLANFLRGRSTAQEGCLKAVGWYLHAQDSDGRAPERKRLVVISTLCVWFFA